MSSPNILRKIQDFKEKKPPHMVCLLNLQSYLCSHDSIGKYRTPPAPEGRISANCTWRQKHEKGDEEEE